MEDSNSNSCYEEFILYSDEDVAVEVHESPTMEEEFCSGKKQQKKILRIY